MYNCLAYIGEILSELGFIRESVGDATIVIDEGITVLKRRAYTIIYEYHHGAGPMFAHVVGQWNSAIAKRFI